MTSWRMMNMLRFGRLTKETCGGRALAGLAAAKERHAERQPTWCRLGPLLRL